MQDTPIQIIWEDDNFIAFSKPSGLLVHRSAISSDRVVMMTHLRDLLGYQPYPIHRLDRPTSGLILFAKYKEGAQLMGQIFQERRVEKKYLAIVRGYVLEAGEINRPVKTPDDYGTVKVAEAQTLYTPLFTKEFPIPTGRYQTSRISLLLVSPQTGRPHQIRIHMDRINHPVVGDTRYGDSRYNYLFRDHFESHRLLLHSLSLNFTHPITKKQTRLVAPPREMKMDLFPESQNINWANYI